ncbi:MAG: HAD-IA family hydrolase, partial [Spirochaetia bacterium]
IRELAGRNVPLAVASGSPPDILKEMLDMTGIAGFFSAAVSSVETGRAKPAPHVYLEAVSRLNLSPDECLAVEDSPYGVESALRAGLRCAGVPTITSPLDPVFRKTGYLVSGGIGEFSADDFLRAFFPEELSGFDPAGITEFRDKVWKQYRQLGRHFPWRKTRDPYEIFVSEIMLQQTQVERGIKKYREFLDAFPTPASLAEAPVGDIYRVWKGLGYNRRALYLKNAAQMIVDEFGGTVPAAPLLLRKLPGVGPSTAGAVAAYAWEIPAVFIETNIRRALIHAFFPEANRVPDSKLELLLRQLTDRDDPRNWYYALTDYGAALGKEKVNANRRSTAYSRQSPFQNSFRQLRGRILAEAAERGEVDPVSFTANSPFSPESAERAFRELVREGFLKKEHGTYRLG